MRYDHVTRLLLLLSAHVCYYDYREYRAQERIVGGRFKISPTSDLSMSNIDYQSLDS